MSIIAIIAVVLQVLLGLGFVMAGGMKLMGTKQSLQQRDHLKIASWFWTFTGAVEIIEAIGLIVGIWLPFVAVLAGLLVLATMIGAAYAHVRNKDSFQHIVSPIIFFVLALIVVILRFPEVTRLLA